MYEHIKKQDQEIFASMKNEYERLKKATLPGRFFNTHLGF